MAKPKILVFAGSLREGSLNKKLAKIAAKAATESGADVTYIDLKDYPLPIYDYDIEVKGFPENALKLKDLFIKNEGFIISSPEYNSSISGVLKNVIDWVSRPINKEEANLIAFTGKTALLVSASPGQLGGLRGLVHLRAILGNILTYVLPQQKCISLADKAFDAEGNLLDKKQEEDIKQLTNRFVEFTIKLINK